MGKVREKSPASDKSDQDRAWEAFRKRRNAEFVKIADDRRRKTQQMADRYQAYEAAAAQ